MFLLLSNGVLVNLSEGTQGLKDKCVPLSGSSVIYNLLTILNAHKMGNKHSF